jgi:hypothetical protein
MFLEGRAISPLESITQEVIELAQQMAKSEFDRLSFMVTDRLMWDHKADAHFEESDAALLWSGYIERRDGEQV